MFLNLDKKAPDSFAIIDSDGHRVTYGELCAFSEEFYSHVNERCIIAVITENCAGACAGYVAAMSFHCVPMMLSRTLSEDAVSVFVTAYQPSFLWAPLEDRARFGGEAVFEAYGYVLLKTRCEPAPMTDELALLLPTSGSTGSPKLVRHRMSNVESNAQAVSQVFEMNEGAVGMVSLPLNFTQGLNVASSHLWGGGTCLLTRYNLTDKGFWQFFREERAQSFTGIPYSYEVLSRLRFFRMELPDLKVINEGGGRMSDELFHACAAYARETGRKFIATYGSTETTSRMTYLPPEFAFDKTGSIGIPFPGRTVTLVDDDGSEVTEPGRIGEIVYRGPNVTLGYAEKREDLLLGDMRGGVYATGDLAYRDGDGCHYIVGRKNRFLKLYGYRIGLDETERLIKGRFSVDCACVGTDRRMIIYLTDGGRKEDIAALVRESFSIPLNSFEIRVIGALPKNDAGKTCYALLDNE